MTLLDSDNGLITQLIYQMTGQKVMVLTSPKWFVPMLTVADIYKGMGWGTILYFAAISGIDPQLYEAATRSSMRATARKIPSRIWESSCSRICFPERTPATSKIRRLPPSCLRRYLKAAVTHM